LFDWDFAFKMFTVLQTFARGRVSPQGVGEVWRLFIH
jgi:hypothetical protein